MIRAREGPQITGGCVAQLDDDLRAREPVRKEPRGNRQLTALEWRGDAAACEAVGAVRANQLFAADDPSVGQRHVESVPSSFDPARAPAHEPRTGVDRGSE